MPLRGDSVWIDARPTVLGVLGLYQTEWGVLSIIQPHGEGKRTTPPPRPERPPGLQPYAVRLVDELGAAVAGAEFQSSCLLDSLMCHAAGTLHVVAARDWSKTGSDGTR